MIATLPESIKKEVILHLQKGNFVAAKAIHDQWQATNTKNKSQIDLDDNYQDAPHNHTCN